MSIRGMIQVLDAPGLTNVVRALVSWIRKEGLLRSRCKGDRTFYMPAQLGLARARENRFQWDNPTTWDGRWTVMIYSVPEECREHGDCLRSTLSRLNFGAIAPGTWVSPRPLPSPTGTSGTGWIYTSTFKPSALNIWG